MAFKKDTDINIRPVLFDNLDTVVDERNASFIAIRRVQWCKGDEEPNRDKSKLEIRRWMIDSNGEEKAGKGLSFLTDEGPHELAKALVHHGYGHTKDVLLELKSREDFKDSVEHLFDNDTESSDGEFFDMRTAMLAEDPRGEEEDDINE